MNEVDNKELIRESIIVIIRKNLEDKINSSMQARLFVNGTGYKDKILEFVPRILMIVIETKEGKKIIDELGLSDEITQLIGNNSWKL